MLSIIVHITNEDAVVCEIDEMPDPTAQFIVMQNPRRRDGKDIHYLDEGVTTMIVSWRRITFIQLLPSADAEDIIGFVRE